MKRAISLDAFRGYAIVMMVLSGTDSVECVACLDVSCASGTSYGL